MPIVQGPAGDSGDRLGAQERRPITLVAPFHPVPAEILVREEVVHRSVAYAYGGERGLPAR